MRVALRRLPLERAVLVTLPITIFVFACGSSSVPDVSSDTSRLRWVALFLLTAFAAGLAVARARPVRVSPSILAALLFVIALAFASAAWSVRRDLTLGRSLSLLVLFVLCSCLAHASAGRPALQRDILLGVLAASVGVAVAGLILLAVEPHLAIQRAFFRSPPRYRGFGYNPDTAPMLYSIGITIGTWFLVRARTMRDRSASIGALLLLVGSSVASGSRGGLVAGFFGALAVVLLEGTGRTRLAWAVSVFGVFVVGFAIGQFAKPSHAKPNHIELAKTALVRKPAARRYVDAQQDLFQLEDEIGRPNNGEKVHRTAFGSSGRIDAWLGTLRLVRSRPLLGYGFGTQEKVFVDRFYSFNGGAPENSYLGILLELGVIGLVAFLALVALIASAGIAAVRASSGVELRCSTAFAAVLVAGLVLAVVQSYVSSVGNIAMLSFWVCAFQLLAARAIEPDRSRA